LISGSIASLVGVAGLADYFVLWLIILGVTIPPMAGIIIANYYVLKKGRYQFSPGTKYVGIYWSALISWILSSVIGYYVKWGVASLNSLVMGFVLYIVIVYLFKNLDVKISSGVSVEDEDGF